MTKSATCLMLTCVAFLVAGCQTKGNVSEGAGYSTLTPNASTRSHILSKDRVFAKQVAAHNRQCSKDPGCK